MLVVGGFVPLRGVERLVPRTAKLFTMGFKLITDFIDLYFCLNCFWGTAYDCRNKSRENVILTKLIDKVRKNMVFPWV
jgi:hypothetical protein